MSRAQRHRARGRRIGVGVLVAGVLSAGALSPPAAVAASTRTARAGFAAVARSAPAPKQVIDAKTDPSQASQVLNTGCAEIANCTWTNDTPITVAYGPYKILGDKLYNCSPESDDQAYAETAIGITDEREETTSLSESLSVKVQIGVKEIAEVSSEFKAFSKQSESFSTSVKTTSAVAVPPGWVGWTQYRVETASVTGHAYITAGIDKLIQVDGIDLSFPGYTDPKNPNDTPVEYVQVRAPMSLDDMTTRCGAIPGGGNEQLGARGARSAPAPASAAAKSFTISVCQATPSGPAFTATVRRGPLSLACTSRRVTGAPPPPIPQATATLIRGDRTYASGSDIQGRIQLTAHRPLPAGRYTLNLRQPERISRHGSRHYAVTYALTVIPISLR